MSNYISIVMSQKTIQIDPKYLAASSSSGVGGGRTVNTGTRRRGRKEKPKAATLVKPDKMKKQWIAKVKEFQKKRQDEEAKAEKTEDAKTDVSEFNDEFSKTMTFFESLASKRQKAKQDRRSRKKRTDSGSRASVEVVSSPPTSTPVSLDLPAVFSAPIAMSPSVQPAIRVSEPVVVTKPSAPVPRTAVPSAAAPSAVVPSAAVPSSAVPSVAVPSAAVPSVAVPSAATTGVPTITVSREANPVRSHNKFPIPALGAQPPYSTLRNGTRPTYRQWKKGQSLKSRDDEDIVPSDSTTERSIKAARSKLRSTYDRKNTNATPSKRRMKKRITRTIRHRVGRKEGKVGVLIKDAHTRKRVQTEKAQLRRTSIVDVKRFLRSRNLIKAGSSAPNDVLRKMYEQCMLSGDLKNESDEVLLHNFMST